MERENGNGQLMKSNIPCTWMQEGKDGVGIGKL